MRLRRTCLLCRRKGWRWAMWRSPLTGMWYCHDLQWTDEECESEWRRRVRADASAELRRLERMMWGRETHWLADVNGGADVDVPPGRFELTEEDFKDLPVLDMNKFEEGRGGV